MNPEAGPPPSPKKRPRPRCNPALLKRLLEDGLTEAEQVALDAHLERCADCRARLERLAAGDAWWDDARRLMARAAGTVHQASAAGASLASPGPPGAGPPGNPPGPPDPEAVLRLLEPSDDPSKAGRLGPYEVIEVIGQGGMGVVLKAYDPSLKRLAAIKVLAPDLMTSPSARMRFAREARAAAAVVHRHVIAIYAVDPEGPLPYLVMPYIAGRSLQERIERTGPLELREILRIGMQTASGLAAAHAQGLVHRDIKPSNILLENGLERVWITDFGLARAADDASLTQSGVVAGTPQYMAPEQARGQAVDFRADLFSLGSMLYAMCTGHSPFRAETAMSVLRRVTEDTPRPIREINPDIPDWLEAIVARLHAKNPADRFSSAAEVGGLLRRCLAYTERPGRRPPPYPPANPPRSERPRAPRPAPSAPPRNTPPAPPGPDPRRHARWAVASAFLTLAALGVLWRWGVPDLSRERGTTNAAPRSHGETPGPSERWALRGRPLPDSPGSVHATAYSPDGKALAVAYDDGTIGLWDLATDERTGTLEGHKGPVWSVAFSPDGATLVSGAGVPGKDDLPGEVKLWDVAAEAEKAVLDGHVGPVYAVAFSPDGRTIASAGSDKTARLWDRAAARKRFTLIGHSDAIRSLAFRPDGKTLATGSLDGTVRLWDPGTGRARLRIEAGQEVRGIAFSPNGTALASTGLAVGGIVRGAGNREGGLKIWDATTGALRKTFKGFAQQFLGVAYSPDGTTLAASSDKDGASGSVTLWDVASGRNEGILPLPRVPSSCAFAPDGQQLAVGVSRPADLPESVWVWDVPRTSARAVVKVQEGRSWFATYSPDGRALAAGGDDRLVKLLDPRTGSIRRSLRGHTGRLQAGAFSPDGKTLATASWDGDTSVRLWDLETGEGRGVLSPGERQIWKVAFSPDGTILVAATGDDFLWFWDPSMPDGRNAIKLGVRGAIALAYSPDGKTLAVGTSLNTIRLVDVARRDAIGTLRGHTDWVRAVAFSPDGKTLASGGSDFAVKLWDVASLSERATLLGPTSHVHDVAFSPDGQSLASVGSDRVLRFWHLATGKPFASLRGHTMDIITLSFAPEDNTVATTGLDGTIRLWDVPAPRQ